MYLIVIPFDNSLDDVWFYYKKWDFEVKIGNIVNIPFGKKNIFWLVVWESIQANIDDVKIKNIIWVLYNYSIFLDENHIKIMNYISSHYYNLSHNSLSLFISTHLKNKFLKNKFDFYPKELNYKFDNKKTLRDNQKEVFQKIISSDKNKFLLYWETGTWKTEIYINLIKYYLDKWLTSLLLVPEIILTNQIYERITKVFWNDVLVINSSISAAKKTSYWESIYSEKSKIIVWTRSSIFYPYKNLWIIIVDEEHDNSYISDTNIRYDSVDVLNYYSDISWSKLLLWSWTPKINHMYEWLKWKYEILYLLK